MSIPAFKNAKLQLTQEGASFPKYVWGYIFSYLTDDVKAVSACSRTCKFMWNLSLNTSVGKHFHFTGKNVRGLKGRAIQVCSIQKKKEIFFKGEGNRMIAMGTDGKQYFFAEQNFKQLTIIDPLTEDEESKLTVLDIYPEKVIKEMRKASLEKRPFAGTVIGCHPVGRSLIIVTQSACTIWEYENAKWGCVNFFLFSAEERPTSSGLYKNWLLIAHENSVSSINLSTQELSLKPFYEFEKTVKLESSCGRLALSKILLNNWCEFSEYQIKENEQHALELEKIGESVTLPAYWEGSSSCMLSRWIVNLDNKQLDIVDAETKETVYSIRSKFIVSWFIVGEFLVYRVSSKLHVIHLPSKCDCTKQLQPLLGKMSQIHLLSLSVACVKDKEITYDMVVQEHDRFKWLQATCSVTPFKHPEKKIEVVDDIIFDQGPRRNRGCKLTADKILLIAGAILLVMTVIAAAILMTLHPGKVIFSGNGVILTLPAVITLATGGASALLLIAIGSYRWYQSRLV